MNQPAFLIYIYNIIVSLIRALATELFVTDTKLYREVRKVTIEMDLDLLLKAHQLGWPLALKWLDLDKNYWLASTNDDLQAC